MTPKLYLDIDGVLLGKNGGEVQFAFGAADFVRYALERYDCYWLTTHCHGSTESVLRHLRGYADDETFDLLGRIKPTDFQVFKTEALNPDDDFIWVDDAPLQGEIRWLKDNDKLAAWFKVDTYADFQALDQLRLDLGAVEASA